MFANRSVSIACIAAALLIAAPAKAAVNLITNGDFSSPNENGNWAIGAVPGWTNLAIYNGSADGVEVGKSTIYGLTCISTNCQSLEVNANVLGDVVQTVTGLTIGQSYELTWDYGGRSGGGAQELDVDFGGKQVATDTGSLGAWTHNSVWVTAAASSETLAFVSVNLGGAASYGNEVTNVSLVAPSPLPGAGWLTPALMLIARAARRRVLGGRDRASARRAEPSA